jgi:hypothetical protein
MGDTAQHPHFIQTVHRRGYRFIAPVTVTNSPPLVRSPAMAGLRWAPCPALPVAELQTAQELGERLLILAQSLHDTALLVEAHRALGNSLFWLGAFVPAHAHLEQAMALYDPQHHRTLAVLYGTDPGVVCRSYGGVGPVVAWLSRPGAPE